MQSIPPRLIAPLVFLVSSFQFPVSSVLAQCGGTWTQRASAAKPSARNGHAMAYDSARRLTVLFGGSAAIDNNETWEWDGANWLQRFTTATPSARADHVMAYDSARGVTVLFGGYAGGVNGETWEWNGTTWTQRMPAVSPSARYGHAMAFDSARGVTVLFGGDEGGGDTWEWDGTNWTQRSPVPAPSARRYQAMAYDSARAVTVLFGGVDDQTWEWDGINWTRRLPVPSPSARDDHAMVYDSVRGVTTLFGGTILAGGAKNAETWEWAGPKPAIMQQPAAQTVAPGQPAAFSITAGGPAPLAYRWRKDGAPFSDAGPVIGAATATLTINPTVVEDSGAYTCDVSNPCGTTVSRAATLVVDPCIAVDATGDCNANGRLDSCDIAADPALDANMNGTLESCESGCGMCGAGVPMMMPLAMFGLYLSAQRRRSRRAGEDRRT